MPTLLHLDSSPLEGSISRELTREYVKTWKNAHPDGTVIYRDLAANAPKPLDTAWIYSSFTPEANRTPEQKATLATSDAAYADRCSSASLLGAAPSPSSERNAWQKSF